VPSYKTIEEGRRKAMENLIDEIMDELRVPSNIPVLHECRTLFRKKVPLTMRAYVAAALAYRFSGPGNTAVPSQSGRGQNEKRGAKNDSRKAAPQDPQREAKHPPKSDPKREAQGEPHRHPQRETQKETQREPRQEPVRENRYQGEGVVLFVGAGRRQRFYARIALRMLIDSGKIQEEQIGDIRTMDNYSFINIDPAAEETAISVLGGTDYKGRLLTVNRAKKKEDQASQD